MRRVRPRDGAFASRSGGGEEEARARGEEDDHDETTGEARADEELKGNECEIPHKVFKVRRRQHGRGRQGTHPRARAPSRRFARTRTTSRVATTENGSRVFKVSIRRQRVRQVSRRAQRGACALSSLGARLNPLGARSLDIVARCTITSRTLCVSLGRMYKFTRALMIDRSTSLLLAPHRVT